MQNGRKKILVVDDDPDILEFIQVVLEDEGYAVLSSDKGEVLEQLPNDGLPDLILVDVLLSGTDGREMTRRLKSQEETRPIPIIMFSAHPGFERIAREAGADDFLMKPFEIDDLLTKIANYL